MDKNVQKEEGISFMDIVRLLLSKIKLLILLVVIGGFIGGAFSVWQTKDVKYYGTQMRFYVNPESPTMSSDGSGLNTSGSEYGVYGAYGEHVFDNMIKLLNEDAFAEEMLLRSQFINDPNTEEDESERDEIYKYLPVKDVWTNKAEEELALELNKAIDDAIPYVEDIIDAEEAIVTAQASYIAAVEEYATALSNLKTAWKNVFGTEYSELKYTNLTEKEKETTGFKNTVDGEGNVKLGVEGMRELELTASSALSNANNELTKRNVELKQAQRNLQEPRKTVFDLWEQTEKYQKTIRRFSSAVHFSFLLSNEDIKDANKFARSFIYADLSVYGEANKEFAADVYNILKDLVPEYVEANMAIPQGYAGTNCQRISRNDGIFQLNQGEARPQAIKSAFIAALAVGVIACVAIIIIDRSDKRLRDCDVITRDFQVPILGIVPTIEMNDNNTAKKGAANKQNKEEK